MSNNRNEHFSSTSILFFWLFLNIVCAAAIIPLQSEGSIHLLGKHPISPYLPLRLRGGNRILSSAQRCRLCIKAGHNARTCPTRNMNSNPNSSSRSDSSDSQSFSQPIKFLHSAQVRKCKCGSDEKVTHGIASEFDGTWQEFLCIYCGSNSEVAEFLRFKCTECRRHANFGPAGGSRRSAIHCKRHQQKFEVNLLSKVCAFSGGCSVRPTFGDSATRVLMFCNRHKRPSDVDLVHRRCEHPGCGTVPTFGDSEEGRTRFCAAHRLPGQFDLVNRRCRHPEGCDVQPTYGSPADGVAAFCAQHRGPQHVDVKSRRCSAVEGCARQPHFGLPGDRFPSFCRSHRHESHVELLNRRSPPAAGAKYARGKSPAAEAGELPLAGSARQTGRCDGPTPSPAANAKAPWRVRRALAVQVSPCAAAIVS